MCVLNISETYRFGIQGQDSHFTGLAYLESLFHDFHHLDCMLESDLGG